LRRLTSDESRKQQDPSANRPHPYCEHFRHLWVITPRMRASQSRPPAGLRREARRAYSGGVGGHSARSAFRIRRAMKGAVCGAMPGW
jgi:hypothetical protein